MNLMYLNFKLGSGEKRNSLVVTKAVGDSSESSSGSIVKSVQTAVSFLMSMLNFHTDSHRWYQFWGTCARKMCFWVLTLFNYDTKVFMLLNWPLTISLGLVKPFP